jgi:transposase
MAQKVWAGVDAGKAAHHCVVVDDRGKRLLSRRIRNTESDLNDLIDAVLELAGDAPVVWATDLNRGPVSLLLALLHHRGQQVTYLPSRRFHHAAALYRGEGKSDAKDAAIIADHARSRANAQFMQTIDTDARHLGILIARRAALIEDRSRAINRMRGLLTEYFPALDASFTFARNTSALMLVSKYQTPTALREADVDTIATWLRGRGARFFRKVAIAAVEAAHSQTVSIPGEKLAATIIGQLAHEILVLDDTIAEVNEAIETDFTRHRYAPIITSLPGFGPVLGSEFLAFTGGNMQLFPSADHLASFSGLAPVAKDSGNISGNHRRPRSYDRRLLRVWYLSSMSALKVDEPSRVYYDRKRSEGKHHIQAILSLSRRRANVMWAMLRDNTPYDPNRQPRRQTTDQP